MITLLQTGDVELSVRFPLVYLDHCALREISSDPEKRTTFLQAFDTRGTLMFSVINLLEMALNTGQSYDQITALLDALGPYWLLSDVDAQSVTDQERRSVPPPASFFTPALRIFAALFSEMQPGLVQLGAALRAVQQEDFRRYARKRRQDNSVLLQQLSDARAQLRAGRSLREPPEPRGSSEWISASLIQRLVRDSKTIEGNDILDLLHAAVPLCFAQIVVLDKTWATYAKNLKLGDVEIFSVREIPMAIDRMTHFDTSAFKVLRPDPPLLIHL